MAVKRNKSDEKDQLDLFSYARSTDHLDTVRLDGREALAGIPASNGEGTGGPRQASGGVAGSGGEDEGRDVRPDHAVDGAGLDGPASPRSSLGNGEAGIHLVDAGSNDVARNQNNYRIAEADGVGEGSLKEKCRANLAAIRLVRKLQSENRTANQEEKSALVRYVGWGGLPQVFSPATDWQAENEELASLLSEDEFRAARATTLNAHYTSSAVVKGMYAALERLGFKQGRILEPACGIGHFIGFIPEAISSHSSITGVEIDPLTAQIAKALYPDADIRNQAFEKSKLLDGFFDLAISNIPFGDYKPFDPKFNEHGFLIHDYFFAAALEKVRPGGLVVFITSRGTMDKADPALRKYVGDRAELLGAIRLPNNAFKRNANTEVTTDVLFLKKCQPGEAKRGV